VTERLLAVLILLASLVDAGLTINAIDRGATEANPLMASLLSSTALFVGFKTALTALGVALLLRLQAVRSLLLMAVVYVTALCYHLLEGCG